MLKFYLHLLICSAVFCGCGFQSKLDISETIDVAGKNSDEIRKVIEHYEKCGDTTKLKAAYFIVKNLARHYTLSSDAIENFTEKVHNTDSVLSHDTINVWWSNICGKKSVQNKIVPDAETLSSKFIIKDIDKAFDVWRNTPWRKDIDFSMFCELILPYRFLNEPLMNGWRDSLYNEYHPLIEKIDDVKKAYALVYNEVNSRMGKQSIDYSNLINVVDMKHVMRGTCTMRCIYIGAVMRALGIPVAIDGFQRWANYSKNGHTWIALVTNDGTYTVARNDSVARKMNPIDASEFTLNYKIRDDYPYDVYFKKKCAKVFRYTFSYNYKELDDSDVEKKSLVELTNPFATDASEFYGLNDTICMSANSKYGYLCTFATGKDWQPVCSTVNKDGKFCFKNMGDSVVYILAKYVQKKLVTAKYPFMVSNKRIHLLKPNIFECSDMVIDRKYPLTAKFVNEWAKIKTGRIEGSNDVSFNRKDVLAEITETPVFRNIIDVSTNKAYRYIRYVSNVEKRTKIAELEVWSENEKCKGSAFSRGVVSVDKAFDGDLFTTFEDCIFGYTFGLDLGKKKRISRIEYYPFNDGNFVIPQDVYQLFYYDDGWVELGTQKSGGYQLTFKNVPSNALFLLKNLTRGEEERIFTYEKGKQIWW